MKLARQSDEAILAVVDPLMDTLMQGSNQSNHAKHVQDFTDRLKAIVTEDNLRRQCVEIRERLGVFTGRELLGICRRSDSVAVVWRQFASKTDDELMSQLVVVERDGRYLVDHAMVF